MATENESYEAHCNDLRCGCGLTHTVSPAPNEYGELSDRYEDDPAFKAVADAVSAGGFTDDDGVHHPGVTVADAKLAAKVLDALSAVGYELTPSHNGEAQASGGAL